MLKSIIAGAAFAAVSVLGATAASAAEDWVAVERSIDVNAPAAKVWGMIGGYCDFGKVRNIPCTYTKGTGGLGTVRKLNNAVEEALDASDVLLTEVATCGPDDVGGFISAGLDLRRPLSAKLSPEDWTRFETAMDSLGLSADRQQFTRPWVCAQVLNGFMYPQFGLRAENAPLSRLTALAQAARKPVLGEFSTVGSLAKFFSSFPPDAELDLLRLAIDNVLLGPGAILARAHAWAEGDPAHEEAYLRRILVYPELYRRLVVERNAWWTHRIMDLAHTSAVAFVAVLPARLVGPHSLIQCLAARGLIGAA